MCTRNTYPLRIPRTPALSRYTVGMLRNIRPLILLLALVAAPSAHAQFTSVAPLNLTITPDYPRPYQTVTITTGSTVIDLSASTVKVSVNGKVVEQGTGVQEVPIVVGGPGETTTVSVTATTGGKSYSKTLSIVPGDVSLIVEPLSTAHPFYEGGRLTAPEGRARLVALADLRSSPGTRIDPATLIYTWKFGDKILQEQSGIGKSVLTVTAPVRYRDAQITLTVTSPSNAVVAQAATIVSAGDQMLRVYRTDPLLGTLFEHALQGTYALPGTEESFTVVPYFFASAPILAWTVNGEASGGSKDITVRSTGSGAGSATLGISAKNVASHQNASGVLTVLFGSNRQSIFGF